MPFEGKIGERMRKALFVTIILLGAFLAVQVWIGLKSVRYIGSGITPANTLVVSGHGEILAVPDIATFTFSVVSDKPTVADAQSNATTLANTITDYVKTQNIDAKDIQTTDYSVNPQYEYQSSACRANTNNYCPPGLQVLKGYEVRQTTTIKVRDTKKAGDLLAGVGSKGATEVSGLNFTFDNPNAVQDKARDKAITDAKQKADMLAQSLGVSLVRVVSFSENGSGNAPRPMAYSAASAQTDAKAIAPEISTGQNRLTDDVSITYEIQ